MAAKNCGKVTFGKIASRLCLYPVGQEFRRKCPISNRFRDKCFFAFYGEIQDGRQKWRESDFWKKSPVDSAYAPWAKNFVEIVRSHTVSEINVLWCFRQKFKMVAKYGRKMIFAKSTLCLNPVGKIFC